MIATILPIDSPLNCLRFVTIEGACSQASAVQIGERATSAPILNASSRPSNSHKPKAKKVLLIDPEDDLREVIQTSLELTTSWNIVTAHSHALGIDLAEVEQPNAILLNVERLDRDRMAILTQLKTHPITRAIPLILMTERVRLADWWQLTQSGVAGAIAKPFDCANLGRQIALFLRWTT
ncbi:MAG: response regulator [Cyanobacteriota bacterium]|nr:response regulator [Cyanobacteriota bacterium]